MLEKLRDNLIGKNVASEVASDLIESVMVKLEGSVMGTFQSLQRTVKDTLTASLMKLLTPKRRIDILRDVLESKENRKPYVITFCGVNGVGKSTNLAKICFWLIENNFKVLIVTELTYGDLCEIGKLNPFCTNGCILRINVCACWLWAKIEMNIFIPIFNIQTSRKITRSIP